MQTVEVTTQLDAPWTAVKAVLSPQTIVEYEGTYEVRSVCECAEEEDGQRVVADAESDGSDLVAEFRVTERPDGYEYEQTSQGPFEHLKTMVVLEDNRGAIADTDDMKKGGRIDAGTNGDAHRTVVSVRSQFTFGGWLAPVVDRLAKRSRRDELNQAVTALARDVTELVDAERADDAT